MPIFQSALSTPNSSLKFGTLQFRVANTLVGCLHDSFPGFSASSRAGKRVDTRSSDPGAGGTVPREANQKEGRGLRARDKAHRQLEPELDLKRKGCSQNGSIKLLRQERDLKLQV